MKRNFAAGLFLAFAVTTFGRYVPSTWVATTAAAIAVARSSGSPTGAL